MLFFDDGSGIGARDGRAVIGPTGCIGDAGVALGIMLGEPFAGALGGMLGVAFGAMLGEPTGRIEAGGIDGIFGGADGEGGGSDARFCGGGTGEDDGVIDGAFGGGGNDGLAVMIVRSRSCSPETGERLEMGEGDEPSGGGIGGAAVMSVVSPTSGGGGSDMSALGVNGERTPAAGRPTSVREMGAGVSLRGTSPAAGMRVVARRAVITGGPPVAEPMRGVVGATDGAIDTAAEAGSDGICDEGGTAGMPSRGVSGPGCSTGTPSAGVKVGAATITAVVSRESRRTSRPAGRSGFALPALGMVTLKFGFCALDVIAGLSHPPWRFDSPGKIVSTSCARRAVTSCGDVR